MNFLKCLDAPARNIKLITKNGTCGITGNIRPITASLKNTQNRYKNSIFFRILRTSFIKLSNVIIYYLIFTPYIYSTPSELSSSLIALTFFSGNLLPIQSVIILTLIPAFTAPLAVAPTHPHSSSPHRKSSS